MNLKRPLRGGEHGADVEMVQRALNKAPSRTTIATDGVYGPTTKRRVASFQKARKLAGSGAFLQSTLDALWPFFDAYGKFRYGAYRAPPAQTPQDKTFAKLLVVMQEFDAHTPGYLWGGGHGVPLANITPYQRLDCSSSTSVVLERVGLFPHEFAWVSGDFESYGEPGQGKYLTIYANSVHVWIRLHKSRWWRFDTSPHRDGGPGPRLRMLPRFTSGFVARHPRGF